MENEPLNILEICQVELVINNFDIEKTAAKIQSLLDHMELNDTTKFVCISNLNSFLSGFMTCATLYEINHKALGVDSE